MYMILTLNEKRVLRFLATSPNRDYSINGIAKACGITPNGAHRLLNKFHMLGILEPEHIANIKSYKLDFSEEKKEKTMRILELAFTIDILEGRIKPRKLDLASLKDRTEACILFGSYITTKQKPNDLDILFVLKQKDFVEFKRGLAKAQDIIPLKIHEVIQTEDDLRQNLKKGDPLVIEALRNGIVLWGEDILVKVVKDAVR